MSLPKKDRDLPSYNKNNLCSASFSTVTVAATRRRHSSVRGFHEELDSFDSLDSPVWPLRKNGRRLEGEPKKTKSISKEEKTPEGGEESEDSTEQLINSSKKKDKSVGEEPQEEDDESPVPTPEMPEGKSLIEFRVEWLFTHNIRRSSLHTSVRLIPRMLQWSEGLADSAQGYALKLTELDGCALQHGYQGDTYGGENLFAHWSYGVPNPEPRNPSIVLQGWWDEEESLNFGANMHFTQAAWYATTYIGCGVSKKVYEEDGNEVTCFIHVCRYLKPGNCEVNSDNWFDMMLAADTPCGPDCPLEGCM